MRLMWQQTDPAAVAFDDCAADGEPDAGAGVFVATVQSLEHPEHPLPVLGGHTDPPIGHREPPLCVLVHRVHGDLGRFPVGELECVSEQVCEHPLQQPLVGDHGRQR